MAREYARVRLSIWADSDFRKLSDPAQSLYFRLITSPTINCCGVADWRPKRLVALTADVTDGYLVRAADELVRNGYIVLDDETEEVLVRSFIRHDGIVKTPNITSAMVKDYAGTSSELLRGVIIHELSRLHDDEPGLKGWSVALKLLNEPSINPSVNPSVKVSVNPSPNPSVDPLWMDHSNPSGNASPIHKPLTINQQPTTPAAKIGEDDAAFETFWSIYPKRVARRIAHKAWLSALKRTTSDEIIAGARRYSRHPDVGREGGKYIKAPASWLNGDCWSDEIPSFRPPGAAGPASTSELRLATGQALHAKYAALEATEHPELEAGA